MAESIEKLLYDLIEINSANPDYSSLAAGEKEIGTYICNYLESNAIECELQEVLPGRPNVLGVVRANSSLDNKKTRTRILLCSHLDTVYLEGMDFSPIIDEKHIYGPGSCDTKSSIAAMLEALVKYSRYRERTADIFFLGAASEESKHLGIRKFVSNFMDTTGAIDLCIIGEPTSLDPGIAHKGSLKFTIKTEGKSAHGSTPELGVNAINIMSKIICSINEKLVLSYSKSSDRMLGHPTLNIGVINGGTAFNIVPDFCRIELDRRVLPSESVDNVLESFKSIISEASGSNAGLFAGIEKVNDYIPFLKTDISNPLAEMFIDSCTKINKKSTAKGLPYATDGGFTYDAGIQTIVFGPGDISNCHRLEEFVSSDELKKAIEVLSDFLHRLSVV